MLFVNLRKAEKFACTQSESYAVIGLKEHKRLLQLPGGLHHHRPVVVGIDGGGHVRIVVLELLLRHNSVGMARIERVQELSQNFILCLLTGNDLGVLLGVVVSLDVSQRDLSIALYPICHKQENVGQSPYIGIHFTESLVNPHTSCVIQLASNAHHELIERDLAITIFVEEVQDLIQFLSRVLAHESNWIAELTAPVNGRP